MKDTYKTISESAEGEYKDRGSKFLAFAFPVGSVQLAKNTISGIRKKYHDARHHCFAYKIGVTNPVHRTFDDGEPSGTAGKPVYGQILSFDLTNILIVVVRYFGGKLLGTGGLIQAYRCAAENALKHAVIIEKTIDAVCQIHFGYENQNDVNKVLNTFDYSIVKKYFDEKCHLTIHIRKSQSEEFIERISAIKDISLKLITDSR
jgi:uncharacterized YigZ family protein